LADFDLAIIGGGINGAGIARDAAGRGLRVALFEQNDLASGTSSKSTKLVHGGLRYLEHGALRLVREGLSEREVLLRAAPHIVRPIRFALTPRPGGWPMPILRLGLFLYDIIGRRDILPPTDTIDLTHHPVGVPLKRSFGTAFEYSDCVVDDARLVVLTALDAAERGAAIHPGVRCARADRAEEWRLALVDRGHRRVVTARALVNAAGPWINLVGETVIRAPQPAARLVLGSHIVVRKLYDHDGAYIFQNPDGRVVFAIPFARDFTLIGTTDRDFRGDLAALAPTAEEIGYLCAAINAHMRRPISSGDVVWAFSGVRALYDDDASAAKDATRDYVLRLDAPRGLAPLLTVYGGKLTTYRRLAERALKLLRRRLKMAKPWTAEAPLPGGDFPHDGLDLLIERTHERWPFLAQDHAERLVRLYGTRVERVMGKARTDDDLGARFSGDLTEREVRYLMDVEWARTAEDVLWRRTKLGLTFPDSARDALAAFMKTAAAVEAKPAPAAPV
jgi:glycerol-3-phosphate dehydrogenase